MHTQARSWKIQGWGAPEACLRDLVCSCHQHPLGHTGHAAAECKAMAVCLLAAGTLRA